MAGVVVLDAGALIALYDSTDRHHPWALEMFRETLSYDLAMSALTLAEVMVHPTRAGALETFEKGIAGLALDIRGVDPAAAQEIAALRATTTLRMPDVVVLHLALGLNAILATTDAALATQAGHHSLSVRRPT
jgi:predicted nucleic acid-binding protein